MALLYAHLTKPDVNRASCIDDFCCPRCGSSDVVPIIFGYPTRETEELAQAEISM